MASAGTATGIVSLDQIERPHRPRGGRADAVDANAHTRHNDVESNRLVVQVGIALQRWVAGFERVLTPALDKGSEEQPHPGLEKLVCYFLDIV